MNKRILVIDDDKELLEEVRQALVLSDYDVVALGDAECALDLALSTKPDLVLLDLRMPQESGFQVACKLKYFSGLKNIPVIGMTAFFKNDYIPLMRTYGIQDYLKKPFDPLDMVSKIEQALC